MQERKSQILQSAISRLPDYKLPSEFQWERIDAELNAEKTVDTDSFPKKILPVFSAPEDVWDKIESQLNESQLQANRLRSKFPEYPAPEGIWEGIEHKLEVGSRRSTIQWKHLVRIAASIILLISVAIGIKIGVSGDQYPAEKLQGITSKWIEGKEMDADITTIITPALCSNNPQICNSKQYKVLQLQWEEIKSELEEMQSFMPKNEDPQLLKYYYRLENEQVNIEKKLIKLIIES